MAPEHIINLIQEAYRKHFEKSGHFVLTQLQVEDVMNEDRQIAIIAKKHDKPTGE